MKFGCEKEAYEWAATVMTSQTAPRTARLEYNPGGKGQPKDYMFLDAMTIMRVARKHDTIDWRGSWFIEWFMPPPTEYREWHWSEYEMARLFGAVKEFRVELERIGYVR